MAQEAGNLKDELDTKLQTLEMSLASAAQATAALRQTLPKIAALAQVLGDIEATMTRIRPQTTQTQTTPTFTEPANDEQASSPWLRPLAQDDPVSAWPTMPTEPKPGEKVATFYSSTLEEEKEAEGEETNEEPAGVSNCLRVDVTTRGTSLDLKAVDSAVNEITEVVDVALLDYDGRSASLKVWVSETSDPTAVRDALSEGLQRRFEDEADIEVNFEEKSAA